MARIIAAKKLGDLLQKATALGEYRESITLDDCEVTFRNLRPDEHTLIVAACAELNGLEYAYAFQKNHIARALCIINGVDLSAVDYIEVESEGKSYKVETFQWVLDNIISTWSKETVTVSYKKCLEIMAVAEERANEKVTFRMIDETPSDKYIRMLGDLKQLEENIPSELVEKLLDEAGYIRKSSLKVDTAPIPSESPVNTHTETPQPNAQISRVVELESPAPQKVNLAELMRQRVPLNTTEGADTLVIEQPKQTVQTPVSPPVKQEEMRAPPPQAIGVVSLNSKSAKTREYEELENLETATVNEVPVVKSEQAVIETPRQGINPKEVISILDKGPTGGLNPKYRSHRG